jgi:hypothetical protein
MPTELNRTRAQSCVSDLRFDRMFAGELGHDETRAIDAHVASCDLCGARRHQLERARAVGADALALEASALHARSAVRRPWSRFARVASVGLGLAALAAGAWLAFVPARPASELRWKGAHCFGFYVQRGSAVYRGAPGERLLPGDRLRFVARTREPRFLTVLSLDGEQHASVYYPGGARAAELTSTGAEQALPASVKLDAVLGAETLYALFCADPLPLEPLRVALEQQRAAFVAPSGCELETLRVQKVTAP